MVLGLGGMFQEAESNLPGGTVTFANGNTLPHPSSILTSSALLRRSLRPLAFYPPTLNSLKGSSTTSTFFFSFSICPIPFASSICSLSFIQVCRSARSFSSLQFYSSYRLQADSVTLTINNHILKPNRISSDKMRSSMILALLLAPLALANPVDKRYLTTKIETVTVWTTVTKGASPTGYPYKSNRHRSSSSVGQPSADSGGSAVVVSTSTLEPALSSSGEAPSAKEPMPTSEPDSGGSDVVFPTSALEPALSSSRQAPTSKTSVSTSEAAPVPATSGSAPASLSTEVASGSSAYRQLVVNQYNELRAKHEGTGPVEWSDKVYATALKIAKSCNYKHDTYEPPLSHRKMATNSSPSETDKEQYDGGYGQNIAAGSSASEIAKVIKGMYDNEVRAFAGLYGQASPSNFQAWGHFSAIVWRDTTQVACATWECSSLQGVASNVPPIFTVCNHYRAGNVGGQYGKNIGRPL